MNVLVALLLASLTALPPTAAREDDALELDRRGLAALNDGRLDEAVTLFDRAHRADPEHAVLAQHLAWALGTRGVQSQDAGDLAAAADDHLRAWEVYPADADHGLRALDVLLRLYRLDEAERVVDEVVERHPAEVGGHYRRGHVLGLLDELEPSVEAYRAASVLAEQGGDQAWIDATAAALTRAERQAAVEADYLTLASDTFVLRHPPGTDLPSLLAVLEQARVEARANLGLSGNGPRVRAVLYPPEAFRAATGTHAWVGGLFDRKIRLPIADPRADPEAIRTVFRHEYVHLLVAEWNPGCPTLLNEGLAQWLEFGSGGGMDRLVALLAQQGVDREDAPRLADLPLRFVTIADRAEAARAYRLSYAFVDHVSEQRGLDAVIAWVVAARGRSLEEAYLEATGRELADEEALFRELLRTAR